MRRIYVFTFGISEYNLIIQLYCLLSKYVHFVPCFCILYIMMHFDFRCGSRTGGQSFVKVRDARRSPETTAWRTCWWAVRWDQRTSGWRKHHHTKTTTPLVLTVLPPRLLVWMHLRTLVRLQTLMLLGARYDCALRQISPWCQESVLATRLTSLLGECCLPNSTSPRCSGPSYSSIAPA